MLKNAFISYKNIILILMTLQVVCFLTVNMVTIREEDYPTFAEFIVKYHKDYDSKKEQLKRQSIYTSNIEALTKGSSSRLNVNYFSDWTSDEIENLMTLKTSGKQQFIASTFGFHQELNARILQENAPRTFDWRNITQMTEVKNTGFCGASWAFSTVAFFQQSAIMSKSANSTLDLSEMYLIACNPENQGCKAGQVESSIELVIDRGGLPLQVKFPYDRSSTLPSIVCLQTDFFQFKNQARMSYFRISDPQTIKKIIFKKPVIASVCAQDFITYSPQSYFDSSRTLRCKPQNRIIDHSVLLIGYTETQWIVKNHWGTGWGIEGYAYISRNPSEDCCIGEQLHSSGSITTECSVQYCKTCVETNSCYKCEPGRWVKHNTTTGVQTCEPCTEQNCDQCYNYMGRCKWCAAGFGLSISTGKCVNATIANCNLISSSICSQCKPGYLLSLYRNACNSFCVVKNCEKCPNGTCNECKAGFFLTSVTVNNMAVQYCQLNNCTVGNCSYCDSAGGCIQCENRFTLQGNGQCTTNCTSISLCISCLSGSTSCTECIEGNSFNSLNRVCEVFNGTTNCRLHRASCTSCRAGYTLSSGNCIQNCETKSCLTCVPNDISYCLTCASGYFLNRTVVYSVCTPYPCNVSECSLCDATGSCISCTNSFHAYNASANRCQNQCSLQNCRDCLPNATGCSYCNVGYGVDSSSKACIPSNISNCVTVFVSGENTFCFRCDPKYYLVTKPTDMCLIWCTDQFCELCHPSSVHICEKCNDGYSTQLINGIATCTLIPSTMVGCNQISLNQSYCYTCDNYYLRNERTGVCEPNTENCPEMCEYCTTNATQYFGCRCQGGFIFDLDTSTCLSNPFNDTNCLMMQFQIFDFYCLQCPQGMVLNAAWNGCDPACTIAECLTCNRNDNSQCVQCYNGHYLGPFGYSCIKCPFQNCAKCSSAICFDCQVGFQLSNNGRHCNKIQCKPQFVYDGYGCSCPIASYQDGDQCKICSISNCIKCSQNQCFRCQQGYFLQNKQCVKCTVNCKICNSSDRCSECKHRYTLFQGQCIFLNSQSALYYTNGSSLIQCQANCLQCDAFGNCLKCRQTTVNYLGVCINCQGFCRSCLFRNTSICTSCYQGFFFNQTTCLKCSQINCIDCSTSPEICLTCKEGFYLANSTCQSCISQNCLACDFNGKCSKCSSGYTLLTNNSCEQCAGNCRECNSVAINQCLIACNLTSYQFEGQCYSCPHSCKTCVSDQICLSCNNEYQLRNQSCLQACSEETCFKCDPENSSLCLECFSGYSLAQNGTCTPEISCNFNQSCSHCPRKWTLVNNQCQICNLSSNCTQCAVGNVSSCIQCQSGFFINGSVCTPCGSDCLKCLSANICQQCREGFFTPRDDIYANCTPCDRNCKTCEYFSTKCITCKEGEQLSVAEKCLSVYKINGTIELNLQLQSFVAFSRQIRSDLLGLMGNEHRSEYKLYIITDLRQGSTILSFYVAIPEGRDPKEAFGAYKDQISITSMIGGVELISIKRLQFVDPSETENIITFTVVNDQEQLNKLALVLGIAIPSFVIIIVIVAYFIKRRISQYNNAVENIATLALDETKEQAQIHRKNKLPPISHHLTHLTPVKDSSTDPFGSTANNGTFLMTPQQQSYEQFYDDNNEDMKPQIVNEFDSKIQNDKKIGNMNLDQEKRRNEMNVDELSKQVLKRQENQKGSNKHNQISQGNQQLDEVVFADDTLRQMNEKIEKLGSNIRQDSISMPKNNDQKSKD